MNAEPNAIRIGELLVKSGFVSVDDLDEALEIAKHSGQRIGRVLTMSEFVSPQRLQSALHAQNRVREGKITPDQALQILQIADRTNISFDSALNQLAHVCGTPDRSQCENRTSFAR